LRRSLGQQQFLVRRHVAEDRPQPDLELARHLNLLRLALFKRKKFQDSTDLFRSILVGNPNYNQFYQGWDGGLKGTEEEIAYIAESLSKLARAEPPVVLQIEDATESNFKGYLVTDPDLIHFAGHGVWEGGDPTKSYLQIKEGITLVEREIEVIEAFNEDECFRANELAAVQFKRPLILILSACESGIREIVGGDEFFG